MTDVSAVLLLLSLAAQQPDFSPLLDGEREILMTLYESTQGRSWSNNSGWGTAASPCLWHGIQCDETIDDQLRARSTVRSIDLRMNGLAGSLPPALTQLGGLKALDVGFNRLGGPVPTQLLARWDRGTLELTVAGNQFSNMIKEVRIDVRNPHLLCPGNWSAIASEGGTLRLEEKVCTSPGDVNSRATHCVIREQPLVLMTRLTRALNRLGYQDLESTYEDKVIRSTHSSHLTTTVRFGDGSEKRVTTSGSHEPLDVWMAQALISAILPYNWETNTKAATCPMVP